MSDPFQAVIEEPKSSSSTPTPPVEKTKSEKPPQYNSVAPLPGPTQMASDDVIDDNLRWCSRCEQTLPIYKKSRFQLRHILMCIFAPGLGWAICMAQCCAGDMVYCTHCHQRYSDFHGKDGCCDCCDCSCCDNCCCWINKKLAPLYLRLRFWVCSL